MNTTNFQKNRKKKNVSEIDNRYPSFNGALKGEQVIDDEFSSVMKVTKDQIITLEASHLNELGKLAQLKKLW